MEQWVQIIVTIACSVIASSGFWTFVIKRSDKKDIRTEMLIGLGHDRIVYLCMQYITRGWITNDEFENLNDYLYKPYCAIGGNGSAERLMKEVYKLPIRSIDANKKSSEQE
jgi:hypothetical protein